MGLLIAMPGVCVACGEDSPAKADEPENTPEETPEEVDPFVLQGVLSAAEELVGKDYQDVHQYMRKFGWDYSEHPNSSVNDHYEGKHIDVVYDEGLKSHVFRFINHAGDALDGDRGSLKDRQRNEMKSQTSSKWYKLNGNWDERQRLEWKFRIPKGFRPSTNFCHIHQLKAQEGNNGAPLITISTRSDSNGGNRRVQVIHTGDVSSTSRGVIIDNMPLADFEDQWVNVVTEMHYTHHGSFSIKITRVSDGKVLADASFDDIDLWRKGAVSIRNKFGIYRSFGGTVSGPDDRPANGIKDETLDLADFKAYECDTNPDPQPHD